MNPSWQPSTHGLIGTRVAVLGANGQVGRALCSLLGDHAIPLTRADLDLSEPTDAERKLETLRPSALVNAAAYTNVDKAESETELAFAINGAAPGLLARWCERHSLPFVHFSTDYVFPGTGERPWREDDPVAPLNAYGRSKLEGEREISTAGGKWLVFRTSWIYDHAGGNFVSTMLRVGHERESLSVVDDQWGAPTYAPHLAEAIVSILHQAGQPTSFPTGVYHACSSGETTWCRFAGSIFDRARASGYPLSIRTITAITTAEYKSPARRPLNSRLDTSKLQTAFGVALPTWQAGLSDCMNAIAKSTEAPAT